MENRFRSESESEMLDAEAFHHVDVESAFYQVDGGLFGGNMRLQPSTKLRAYHIHQFYRRLYFVGRSFDSKFDFEEAEGFAISYEAVASVVRELSIIEALMCFFTIATKYNEPLASINCDIDDDRYDIDGCGAAGEHAVEPLRSGTSM